MMKFLMTMLLATLSFTALADKHSKDWDKKFDKMSFEDAKKMMIEKSDSKSAMIGQFRSCVNEAKDKNALKLCKEEKKEAMGAMKDEMKQKKQSEEAREE